MDDYNNLSRQELLQRLQQKDADIQQMDADIQQRDADIQVLEKINKLASELGLNDQQEEARKDVGNDRLRQILQARIMDYHLNEGNDFKGSVLRLKADVDLILSALN